MLTYRRFMLLLLIPLFAAFTNAAFSQAEAKGPGKSKVITAKADTTRGLEDAVKAVPKGNDPKAMPAKPPNKGGSQTKGAGGYTRIENWTGWYIAVYARIGGNWYYEGEVTPYGDLAIYTGSLCSDLYGAASFRDGSSLHWGTSYVCSDTWKLTE